MFALAMAAATPMAQAAVGIWTTSEELASRPVSGPAWENVLAAANKATGSLDLSNQDDPANVVVLAKALVYARTRTESYRQDVIAAIQTVATGNTESGARTLALCRELGAYVVAADLVGLPADLDASFRTYLANVRVETMTDGRNLIQTHEERPNNWGPHCGFTRSAIARYLGDTTDLQRAADVFRGHLGNRAVYAGFTYGDLSWQANPAAPVGINPQGATIQGHDVDGVIPDDQRRAGSFAWPPPKTGYSWEALQGVVASAVVLYRAGYTDVWSWENQAIRRAVDWLHRTTFSDGSNFPAEGDDTWQPHIVNQFYGTSYPAPVPTTAGKNMGWTDWTLSGSAPLDQPPQNVRGVRRVDTRPP